MNREANGATVLQKYALGIAEKRIIRYDYPRALSLPPEHYEVSYFRQRRSTVCLLWYGNHVISLGAVILHPGDTDKPVRGELLAFKRALEELTWKSS